MNRRKLLAVILTAALAAAPCAGGIAVYAEEADAGQTMVTAYEDEAEAETETEAETEEEAETEAEAEVEAEGTLGTCSWTLQDGVLTIAPADGDGGTLAAHAWDADWYAYADSITSVVIEEGVTAAEDSSYLFSYLANVTSFTGLENLDTSAVTNMEGMFGCCSSLITLDLSGFDTSNVTNMNSMLYGCSVLYGVNLYDMNTSNVTTTAYMFAYCYQLGSLNLSGWDTSGVVYMTAMFAHCNCLTTISVSDLWSTESVTESKSMFLDCTSLVGGRGTAYSSDHTDAVYARVDAVGKLGYLTYVTYTGSNTKADRSTGTSGSTSGSASGSTSGSTAGSAKAQTITIKKSALKKTIKYKKLKKKKQVFKLKASASGNGKITYKKVSGNKKIKISSSGKVTVGKGLKKKTYKVTVKITAAGTSSYKKASVKKTLTIKVK